jgi:hypothetical protein
MAGSIPAAWHNSQSTADHHKGKSKMADSGSIVSTTLLEVLIFSGDKETREYDGRKHIGAGMTQQ